MTTNNNKPKTREEIFAKKADTYEVCYSLVCPLREHCLHSILSSYVPADRVYVPTVNLNNPKMQRDDCPQFRKDEPIRMPIGLATIYYDMPSRTTLSTSIPASVTMSIITAPVPSLPM